MQSNFGAAFEIKLAASDTGEFEGHASVFDVKDSHGDIITPGAFKDHLAERKSQGRGFPPMQLMHSGFLMGDSTPIGVWKDIQEDSKGLAVKGKISGATTTDAGRLIHEKVKDGALPGLSIGWSRRPNGIVLGTKPDEPKRWLKSLDLHEISLVSDPSNAQSLISAVKAMGQQPDVSAAAASVAAAIAMHDKTMSGYGYGGGNAKNAALMMDHLRDAHEALTGSRAPHGLEGWTKGMLAEQLIESVKSIFGLSDEQARGFADLALQASRSEQESGTATDPELKTLLSSFAGFSMPQLGAN